MPVRNSAEFDGACSNIISADAQAAAQRGAATPFLTDVIHAAYMSADILRCRDREHAHARPRWLRLSNRPVADLPVTAVPEASGTWPSLTNTAVRPSVATWSHQLQVVAPGTRCGARHEGHVARWSDTSKDRVTPLPGGPLGPLREVY